jgi:peptidoglycan/LPS O-acetylase OafA/YrhL
MVVFIGVELTVSGLVGHALLKNAMSVSLSFTLQGLLHVSSFFLGGFLIGVVSPKLRIWEPAIGGFLAVLLMFVLTAFIPNVFVQFEGGKVLMAGGFALVLALVGARLGEKLTGNLE